jgi:5-hydroxyisourate hydrolase-like protein (transthyretin family)
MSRPTIRLLVAAAVAVLVGTAVAQVPATAASTVRVKGTVSDSEGYPLPGIRVSIAPVDLDDDTEFPVATTDGQGRFTSAAVPISSKRYRLTAADPTGRHLPKRSASFKATSVVAPKDLVLADAGVIRGKVSLPGSTPKPATGILVEADRVTEGTPQYVNDAFTSSAGGFNLGALTTGTYRLTFLDYDEDGTKPGRRYRPTCYDNVPVTGANHTCAGETTVQVEAGKVTTINPQVMGTRIGRLSGTVVDTTGKPIKYATVSVYSADEKKRLAEDELGNPGGRSRTWRFDLDHSGPVKIVAEDRTGKHRATWYVKATSWTAAKAIAYDGLKDVSDIQLVLPKS